jgi:hypothetical protein
MYSYYHCTHHCSSTTPVLTILLLLHLYSPLFSYQPALTWCFYCTCFHHCTVLLLPLLHLHSPRLSYYTCTHFCTLITPVLTTILLQNSRHCTLTTRLLITELLLHLHSPLTALLLHLYSPLYSYNTCTLTITPFTIVLLQHLFSAQFSHYTCTHYNTNTTSDLTAVPLLNCTHHSTLNNTFIHHCTLSYLPLASYIYENIHR